MRPSAGGVGRNRAGRYESGVRHQILTGFFGGQNATILLSFWSPDPGEGEHRSKNSHRRNAVAASGLSANRNLRFALARGRLFSFDPPCLSGCLRGVRSARNHDDGKGKNVRFKLSPALTRAHRRNHSEIIVAGKKRSRWFFQSGTRRTLRRAKPCCSQCVPDSCRPLAWQRRLPNTMLRRMVFELARSRPFSYNTQPRCEYCRNSPTSSTTALILLRKSWKAVRLCHPLAELRIIRHEPDNRFSVEYSFAANADYVCHSQHCSQTCRSERGPDCGC